MMKQHLLLCLCASLASCSSSEQAEAPPITSDASIDSTADSAADSAADSTADSAADSTADSSVDSPTDSPPDTATETATAADSNPDSPFLTCENTCAQTSLSITIGSVTKNLNRAQFGFDNSGTPLLYIEAHFGGDPACPSTSSPSPDRTVIFASIPVPVDSTPIESTPVTLLDFKGDLSTNPFDKATKVKLTPVAINTTPAATAFVAFDVEVSFAPPAGRAAP